MALTVAMEGHGPTRFPSGWGRRYTTANLPLAVFFYFRPSPACPSLWSKPCASTGRPAPACCETDIAPADRYLRRGLMSGSLL